MKFHQLFSLLLLPYATTQALAQTGASDEAKAFIKTTLEAQTGDTQYTVSFEGDILHVQWDYKLPNGKASGSGRKYTVSLAKLDPAEIRVVNELGKPKTDTGGYAGVHLGTFAFANDMVKIQSTDGAAAAPEQTSGLVIPALSDEVAAKVAKALGQVAGPSAAVAPTANPALDEAKAYIKATLEASLPNTQFKVSFAGDTMHLSRAYKTTAETEFGHLVEYTVVISKLDATSVWLSEMNANQEGRGNTVVVLNTTFGGKDITKTEGTAGPTQETMLSMPDLTKEAATKLAKAFRHAIALSEGKPDPVSK